MDSSKTLNSVSFHCNGAHFIPFMASFEKRQLNLMLWLWALEQKEPFFFLPQKAQSTVQGGRRLSQRYSRENALGERNTGAVGEQSRALGRGVREQGCFRKRKWRVQRHQGIESHLGF